VGKKGGKHYNLKRAYLVWGILGLIVFLFPTEAIATLFIVFAWLERLIIGK
jgi:hypothetical protein